MKAGWGISFVYIITTGGNRRDILLRKLFFVCLFFASFNIANTKLLHL